MILQTCIPMRSHSVGMKDATIPENLKIPPVIFHYGNSKCPVWWPRWEKRRFPNAGDRNCFLCAAIGPVHQGRRSSILFDVFDRTEQLLDVMKWKAQLGVGARSKELRLDPPSLHNGSFLLGCFLRRTRCALRRLYCLNCLWEEVELISLQRDFRAKWFSLAATTTQWWICARKMDGCLIYEGSNKQPEPINIYGVEHWYVISGWRPEPVI